MVYGRRGPIQSHDGGSVRTIAFTKTLAGESPADLVSLARRTGLGGYDLAVRPGNPVTPENAATELAKVAELMRESGLEIPIVTLPTDLTEPDDPRTRPILAAMRAAAVPMLKLGYFKFQPETQSYRREVARVRDLLARWEELAGEHGVKACFHTHSNRCMGLNAAALAHLLEGRDPSRIGAYLDTCHLCIEGEEFATACAMVADHLSIVALKDVLLERVVRGEHGSVRYRVVEAGGGMVDFTAAVDTLRRVGFAGPLSIHCEFETEESDRLAAVEREVRFLNRITKET